MNYNQNNMSPFSDQPPENVTNGQLYMAIMRLSQKQNDAVGEITRLRKEYEDSKLQQKELVETWMAAKNTLRFLKFLAMIGLPLGTVMALVTNLFSKG